MQGFIESSKFEAAAGGADAQAVQRLTADAQAVFVVLLAIARHATSAAGRPGAAQAARIRVGENVGAVLEVLADRVGHRGVAAASEVEGSRAAFERSIAHVDAAEQRATGEGMLELYRELAVAVNRLAASGGRWAPAVAHSIVAG